VGGAVQLTEVDVAVVVATAITVVGAPGRLGLSEFEAVDAGLVPAELVALTVNVYGVPVASPDTVQPVAPVVHQKPPGLEVAV
jgi:hypothetical protein